MRDRNPELRTNEWRNQSENGIHDRTLVDV